MGGPQQGNILIFSTAVLVCTPHVDVALGRGVKENDWSTGFSIRHAVVDAIYAANSLGKRLAASPSNPC